MNLKYIKISVYIMSALLALGIPILIIGMVRSTHAPAHHSTENSQVVQSNILSPNVTNLEKFGNVEIQAGENFHCDKPQVQRKLVLLYCVNSITHKQKIISIDLYTGTTLGTITY